MFTILGAVVTGKMVWDMGAPLCRERLTFMEQIARIFVTPFGAILGGIGGGILDFIICIIAKAVIP